MLIYTTDAQPSSLMAIDQHQRAFSASENISSYVIDNALYAPSALWSEQTDRTIDLNSLNAPDLFGPELGSETVKIADSKNDYSKINVLTEIEKDAIKLYQDYAIGHEKENKLYEQLIEGHTKKDEINQETIELQNKLIGMYEQLRAWIGV